MKRVGCSSTLGFDGGGCDDEVVDAVRRTSRPQLVLEREWRPIRGFDTASRDRPGTRGAMMSLVMDHGPRVMKPSIINFS